MSDWSGKDVLGFVGDWSRMGVAGSLGGWNGEDVLGRWQVASLFHVPGR